MSGQVIVKKYHIYMILAGLAILALTARLDTGISYGMVIGENEGVAVYVATQIVTVYVGTHVFIDIFFDPIGYALIIAGFALMGKSVYARRAIAASAAGAAANVIMLVLPMFMQPKSLILPLIALHLLQVLAAVTVMYALTGVCTRKIDNYRYMQVGKDLKFAADLYGTSLAVGKLLQIFTRADWYFSRLLYIIVSLLGVAVMGYYIVKALKYMRMLDMFLESQDEGGADKI